MLLSYLPATDRPVAAPVSRRLRVQTAAVAAAACTALVALCVVRHGPPIDGSTWAVLVGLPIIAIVAGALRSRSALAAIGVFCLYLAMPDPFVNIPFVERWSLFDDRGGREGTWLSPGLRFGHDGPNTALLEAHLGRLEPNWWQQAPRFPHIRDGNERVDSRSMIRSDNLAAILAMLPSKAARQQVLDGLADPENRLRVHQGLLLACLHQFGYPAGHDADAWWAAHASVFVREPDPVRAAEFAYGWHDEVHRLRSAGTGEVDDQMRAVSYYVRGTWGRNYDFGMAYQEIDRGPRAGRAGLPRGKVVWWPERARTGGCSIPKTCLIFVRPVKVGTLRRQSR